MKALVLGGTGFIGRRLVDYLIKDDWDVTIATSGKSPNPFGDAVSTVVFDRFNIVSIEDKLSSPPYFDVLFDQICFGPGDAKSIVEDFDGRMGHYVFVSSGAVYGSDKPEYREEDFDPYSFRIQEQELHNLGYSDGKRSAEAYLFQNAPFPVAAARFPVVIGHDDSTLRFQSLVNDVMEGNPIYIPREGGRSTYVWVDDAGRFLSWLGKNGKKGPYNAASKYKIDARELVEIIGEVTGTSPNITDSPDTGSKTTYQRSSDQTLSSAKAESEGFEFSDLKDWIRKEIKLTMEGGGKSPNSVEYFVRRFSGN